MSKTALIVGCNGQDGSYLAELLLEKEYKVIGLVRRASSTAGLWRLKNVIGHPNFKLVEGDVTDYACMDRIINREPLDEIYNLAAQSHVHSSFNQPLYTTDATYIGCLNILEILRQSSNYTKLYQASSSEMFGNFISMDYDVQGCSVRYNGPAIYSGFIYENRNGNKYISPESKYDGIFQDIDTPFNPQSPYGIAKLAAHHAVKLYRKSYDIFACSGILFNHESPRRGDEFVTKKIVNYIKALSIYKKEPLHDYFPQLRLGNLNAKRDWGYAKEYVEAMWLMLQQNNPDDYIVATGETHSIEEFVELAFKEIGENWKDFVEIDKSLFRPSEVPYLCGHGNTIEKLGWKPKVKFAELVKIMVNDAT